MDIVKYNQSAWDNYVDKKDRWTIPVTEQDLQKAKSGEWNIVLTPKKPVPHHWFPNIQGLKVLGLASGGGQQGPILAALGAEVTIFDNSKKQLEQDQKIANKYGLQIKTIQGDMQDLSSIQNNAFDVVFNPCSVLFIENVKQVWKECYRILKPGGILMAGLMNPIVFQLDENTLQIIYKQPFSDIHSLPQEKLKDLKSKNEALIFGHSLSDQMGGQLEEGFVITDMYEDDWGGENIIDPYFPGFIATRALKK